LVPGARIDLSHWSKNATPRHLKRDTSVEIALAFVRERELHRDVEVVANNHFDADGVIAVWCLLRPQIALDHESMITGAAETGDFDEWPSDERGLFLEAAIAKLSQGLDDDEAYRRVLPELDHLVPDISSREDLWGDAYGDLLRAGDSVSRGEISVERRGRIAVFAHAAGVQELPGPWMSRLRPAGTDRTLIAFADDDGGHRYRYELPRYAWADTVVRPILMMPKRGPIRRALGEAWVIKGRKGMTGLAYTARAVPEPPWAVAETIARVA
jgi:hypothetical protein